MLMGGFEMDAKVEWKRGLSFEGIADSGFSLPLGTSKQEGGEEDGFRPMELLLIGLAGCTSMDVISIMKKKQQDVTKFEVKVHADRAPEHPKVFTHIEMEYVLTGRNLDPVAASRSIELSETKYCPAMAMLRKAVDIHTKITLLPGN
jgi:putative redox protein